MAAFIGELNHNAKLTNEQVRIMRALHDGVGIHQVTLAKIFNVSVSQVKRIVSRKQWAKIV